MRERKITGVKDGQIVKPMSISALAHLVGIGHPALITRVNGDSDLCDISFMPGTRRIAVADAKKIADKLKSPAGPASS